MIGLVRKPPGIFLNRTLFCFNLDNARHRLAILGIKTTESYQCIFVDTPGIHDDNSKAIHRYMNRAATSMLDDADLICVLLDVTHFNQDDENIMHGYYLEKNK